jgi:hypothetical protein
MVQVVVAAVDVLDADLVLTVAAVATKDTKKNPNGFFFLLVINKFILVQVPH